VVHERDDPRTGVGRCVRGSYRPGDTSVPPRERGVVDDPRPVVGVSGVAHPVGDSGLGLGAAM